MRYYPIDHRPEYAPKADFYIQYAEVYKNAVQLLLKSYIEQRPLHDYSLAPVLTLLIQYIGLILKGIILQCRRGPYKPISTHDLSLLYKTAIKEVNERFGYPGKANEDVERFIITLVISIRNPKHSDILKRRKENLFHSHKWTIGSMMLFAPLLS